MEEKPETSIPKGAKAQFDHAASVLAGIDVASIAYTYYTNKHPDKIAAIVQAVLQDVNPLNPHYKMVEEIAQSDASLMIKHMQVAGHGKRPLPEIQRGWNQLSQFFVERMYAVSAGLPLKDFPGGPALP